jgi:hypothetical protein
MHYAEGREPTSRPSTQRARETRLVACGRIPVIESSQAMNGSKLSWLWFALAIGALAAAVAAKAMSALFYLLAIAFLVAGIWFVLRRP